MAAPVVDRFFWDYADVEILDSEEAAGGLELEVFHLPGKHNQQSHGHNNVGGEVSAGEGDISSQLEAAGLDPDTAARVQKVNAAFQERYGVGVTRARQVADPDSKLVAQIDGDTLEVNPRLLNDANLARAEAEGLLAPGVGSVEGLTTHELSHVVLQGGRFDRRAIITADKGARKMGGGGVEVSDTSRKNRMEQEAERLAFYHRGGDQRPPWLVGWGDILHEELGVDRAPITAAGRTRKGYRTPGWSFPDDWEEVLAGQNLERLHLPGKHNQRSHGHNNAGAPTIGEKRPGMGDIEMSARRRELLTGGSGEPHLEQRADGSWGFTAERQALHDEIVRDTLAGKTPVDEPVFHMLGGGPASGKTTVARQKPELQDPNMVVIGHDDVKARLPEYQARIDAKDPSAGPFTHEESAWVANRIQAAALERRLNVTVDAAGDAGPRTLRSRLDAIRAQGYRVQGHYITIPTSDALQRAAKRSQKTGRVVPPAVLTNVHASVSRTLPRTYDAFDSVDLYDNRESGNIRHVMSWRDGTFTVHDQNLWDEFVAKGAG